MDALDLPPLVQAAVQDLWYSSTNAQWMSPDSPTTLSYAAALNHLGEPSLRLEYDEAFDTYLYITKRPVGASEELTVDYRELVEAYGDGAPGAAKMIYSDPERWYGDGRRGSGGGGAVDESPQVLIARLARAEAQLAKHVADTEAIRKTVADLRQACKQAGDDKG